MYGKIFKSIYYGSLAPKRDARELMIFLCVHSDRTGYVDMTLDACGKVLGWADPELHEAGDVLLAPDPDSTSTKEEGRRILARSYGARGIHIVNYEDYRAIQSEADKKEYAQRYYLDVTKPRRKGVSSSVKKRQEASTHSREAEADVEAEGEAEKKKRDTVHASRARFAKPTLEDVRDYCLERKNGLDPGLWFDHYESNGWLVGRSPMRSWKAAVRTWEKNGNGFNLPVGGHAAQGKIVRTLEEELAKEEAEDRKEKWLDEQAERRRLSKS